MTGIDDFITSASDGFAQIYTAVNPPAVATVTPLVYTSQAINPLTGQPTTQVGLDFATVLLAGAVFVSVWSLLKR